MFIFNCAFCGKETHSLRKTRFCSIDCGKLYQHRAYADRNNRGIDRLPTGTIGAMSELFAAYYLMKNGFSVFRAMSPACFCDLVAVKNGHPILIEVRTYCLTPGGVVSFNSKTGSPNVKWFAVVSNGKIGFVKVGKIHKKKLTESKLKPLPLG